MFFVGFAFLKYNAGTQWGTKANTTKGNTVKRDGPSSPLLQLLSFPFQRHCYLFWDSLHNLKHTTILHTRGHVLYDLVPCLFHSSGFM